MNNRNSDKKLVDFLKQYRPNIPEAAPDLEQKLLAALERNEVDRPDRNNLEAPLTASHQKRSKIACFRKSAFPAAIAAGLLLVWSGYRALDTAQLPADETAHLEAFLVTNWEGVLNDSRGETPSDRPQTDWLNFDSSINSKPPTNN
ncbi:MAG: hypothetical protein HC789_23580 [Microcoleus sp. CSU_2_2]|nr:hypothetical protein [Microcoleus sp. SU_5_3]NJS13138.1 hypothetical protein [Microcoleus sp. CSU_2_2]